MMNCKRGFTLVESILALAIMSASALILYGAAGDMNKKIAQIKLSRQSKDIISEFINSLSTSAPLMQINYSASATFPNQLPIAWDTNGKKVLVSDCGNPCNLKGRMAVLILPTENKRLFRMKIRMTHPEWLKAKESSYLLGGE